jgi:hypothetical protein
MNIAATDNVAAQAVDANAGADASAATTTADSSAMEAQVWQNIYTLVQSLVLHHIGKN